MLVGSGAQRRIAFLADHEGWGNVYSLGADATGLRRHTDHGAPGAPAFYARHASTDGRRVVYESAGELWILDALDPDAEPRRLDDPARRAAHGPHPVPRGHRDRAALGGPGPHRPLQHRAGPGHGAPAHPPGRPGPHAARRPGRPGPAGPPARRRLRGVDRRRRGRGRALRRPARRAGARTRSRCAGTRSVSWAGCSSWPPPRTGRPWRSPRTTGGCWCSTRPTGSCASWPAGPTARSPTCAGRRTAPGSPTGTRSSPG